MNVSIDLVEAQLGDDCKHTHIASSSQNTIAFLLLSN